MFERSMQFGRCINLGELDLNSLGTTNGMYPKIQIGKFHYKLGDFSVDRFIGREVITEVIGRKLAQALGVCTFDYKIVDVECIIKGMAYKTLATESENYLNFYTYGSVYNPANDAVPQLISIIGSESFSKMVFLDGITEQKDRHINNVGLSGNNLVLFDYGRSLMFDVHEDLLYRHEDYNFFKFTHYKDFNLSVKDLRKYMTDLDTDAVNIDAAVDEAEKMYNACLYKTEYIITKQYFREIRRMMKEGLIHFRDFMKGG